MNKTKCPHCKKSFNDSLKRYILGSASNSLKFSVNFGLQAGLSIFGSRYGNMAGNAGSRLGELIAKKIGCSTEDMKGWYHHCPYCGHIWEWYKNAYIMFKYGMNEKQKGFVFTKG